MGRNLSFAASHGRLDQRAALHSGCWQKLDDQDRVLAERPIKVTNPIWK
jgi:hypothetical protein